MSERQRRKWDQFYRDLVSLQDRTLELAGDDLGADLYELLGDARVEAESIAAPGWAPTDIGLLPVSDMVKCPDCDGSGMGRQCRLANEDMGHDCDGCSCYRCKGSGTVPRKNTTVFEDVEEIVSVAVTGPRDGGFTPGPELHHRPRNENYAEAPDQEKQ